MTLLRRALQQAAESPSPAVSRALLEVLRDIALMYCSLPGVLRPGELQVRTHISDASSDPCEETAVRKRLMSYLQASPHPLNASDSDLPLHDKSVMLRAAIEQSSSDYLATSFVERVSRGLRLVFSQS